MALRIVHGSASTAAERATPHRSLSKAGKRRTKYRHSTISAIRMGIAGIEAAVAAIPIQSRLKKNQPTPSSRSSASSKAMTIEAAVTQKTAPNP